MKKIIKTTLLLLLCSAIKVSAQTIYQVPSNYVLKAKTDYPQYEQDVVKTADWLLQTPLAEQAGTRQSANKFIMDWVSGSPNVNVTVGKKLLDLTDKNPDFMFMYFGLFAKYSLEHKDSTMDSNKADMEVLTALINKYKNDPAVVKDSDLDKLAKLYQDGKLENWIAKEFHK